MKMLNKNLLLSLVAFYSFGLTGQIALAAGGAAVNLGTAANFTILSKTGISTTGTTYVVGDLGVSPAAATYITGFGLVLPSAGQFSTSALVSGRIYAPGYADPAPANLTTAVLDMQNAYTAALGQVPDVTELGAGNIGGLTLAPGVYKWGTGLTIPNNLTLSGGANDVWIFQVAQDLNISSATKVILAGGAQANNIFWVVAGQTTIGTTAVFNGNILDQTAIVLNTGAQLNGRALAQSAVTLDANNVTGPTSVSQVMTPPPPSYSSNSGTMTTQTQYQTTAEPSAVDVKAALQASLDNLRGQLQAMQGQNGIRTIDNDLRVGSRGSTVGTLQQFLISQNKGPAAEALGASGPTTYFGPLTRAALAEFQAKAGITPAFGNFGVITRTYLMANY